MLNFNNKQLNTFYVSLNDMINYDIEDYYFLFVFINYQTNKKVKCILQKEEVESCGVELFDKFNIDLNEIIFEDGFYKYHIFQMQTVSPLDYDETNYISLLEVGKCYVKGNNVVNTMTLPTIDEEEAYTPII